MAKLARLWKERSLKLSAIGGSASNLCNCGGSRGGLWRMFLPMVSTTDVSQLLFVFSKLTGSFSATCKRFYWHWGEFFTTAQNEWGVLEHPFFGCKASAQENMQPTIASRRHWQWGLRNMWTLGRCRKRKHNLSYDFFSFVISFASTSASASLSKEREEAGMRKFKSLDKRQSRCVSKSQAWFCQERRRLKENLEVRSSEHSKLSRTWHESKSHLWSNHSHRSYSCRSYSRANQCCKC